VAEVIVKLVSNPKFAKMMQSKINTKVDVKPINQEIANYKKQLKQANMAKDRIIEEIDLMDAEDRHFEIRKKDLNDRLNKMYDKIEESSDLLATALNKKRSIEADKLTVDNIYKVLICFDKLYDKMNQTEKRQLVSALVDKVEIYEEKQENGQWLKSITFKLPIIEGRELISLDNSDRVETVCLLSRKEPN
jgi:site-specific DNA recombinase